MRDKEHVLSAYLDALVELCEAKTGAVFAVSADRPVLAVSVRMSQAAFDLVNLAWGVKRNALETGGIVRGELGGVLALLREAGMVGVLYLDNVPDTWDPYQRRTLDLVADLVAQRTAPGPALARLDPDTIKREQVVQALRRAAGNVARAARLLGISRQAFYNRAGGAGIDPAKFRE